MKDKLQEAAAKFIKERHQVYDEAINADIIIDFANYASTQHKEEIEELVSALEASNKVIQTFQKRKDKFFGTSTIQVNESLIQKNRK